MSAINSIGSNTPIKQIQSQPVQKQLPAEPAKQVKLTDRVELSKMMATLKANDVRADKVAAVKAQIAAGTYETEAKLDAAVNRLMDDLGR